MYSTREEPGAPTVTSYYELQQPQAVSISIILILRVFYYSHTANSVTQRILLLINSHNYIRVAPKQTEVLKGLFFPWCEGCGSKQLLQAVGIIGAIIMPHNIYLHSALVKSRDVNREKKEEVREANKYFFIEAAIALFISFLINIFVVSIFAEGFYGRSAAEIYNNCIAHGNPHSYVFNTSNEEVTVDLYRGGVFLGCQFGPAAMYIWAVGLFAAGQSSTMTGTYTGQFVMEGFFNLRWKRWQRVLLTRTIAILPTVLIAAFNGIDNLTKMNDLLNVLMSLQLPFALFPILAFTSSKAIMNDFVNGKLMKIISSLLTLGVISINIYFVVVYIQDLPQHWAIYFGVAVVMFFYIAFVIYLAIFCFAVAGIASVSECKPFGLNFGPKYVLETNNRNQDVNTELTESTSTLDDNNTEADYRSHL
ncbi:natural resistance-associated macrophage protein 2-like [Gigantopelta aegis]|uniref:natural resistance-associated macrophage protein 2-like n=1 Tax=Gigantopelta aegis TaxID=1735272 RepID=UPI001B8895BF|nr:natural resistance-associated macrophage protein 2-like [Gigantopelta aegis]